MKVVTVRSPWSFLILHGLKPLEVRSWATSHRGQLGIHVAARPDPDAPEFLQDFLKWSARSPVPLGHLCGEVTLVDVRPMRPEDADAGGARCDYCPGYFVWVLETPILYPEPVPLRGALGVWNYPG